MPGVQRRSRRKWERQLSECDGVRNGYPTQKPVGLLKKLIEQSSNPGELVADPFGGSFSTGVASALLGRGFAGCDISEAAVFAGKRTLSETPFLSRAP